MTKKKLDPQYLAKEQLKAELRRARQIEYALPQCLRVLDELDVDVAELHAYSLALRVRAYKTDPDNEAADIGDAGALMEIASEVGIGQDVFERAELILEVMT